MPVTRRGGLPPSTGSGDNEQLSETETSTCRSYSGLRRRGHSIQHTQDPQLRLHLQEQLHMRFWSVQDGTTQLFRERLLAGEAVQVIGTSS